ncbi:MAG: GGDEF domain-containing protein [Pseudomonadota bacterium]
MTTQNPSKSAHDTGDDAQDDRAHVVNPNTLLESLDKISHRALHNSGSVFPPTCGWVVLDDMTSLRKQLGFSGLEKLMRAIHTRLRNALSPGDLTARFGIDSIALVLEPLAGEREFEPELSQVLAGFCTDLFEVDDVSIAATASLALYTIDEQLNPAEQNLVIAATAAESVSQAGGNRVHMVEQSGSASRQSDSALIGRLTKALRDNSMKFLYQPLLSTSGCNRERFQLLPRLVDEDGKLIPAARFIPVAAERGVLPAVDCWMIRQAIDLLKGHQDAGSDNPLFFLNQSPALIDDPDLLDWLHNEIDELDRERRSIVLEFSIHDLKSRIKSATPALEAKQQQGLSVSITGIDEQLPEPVVLEHLPANYLRMNADFARRMLVSEQLHNRFERFARAAHEAKRELIIPMLEDADSVARIWQMDVDLIQGNFIQQPSETPQT